MHLAAFAAAEGGLFAEQGLEVEFVPAARAPDLSLSGFTARVKAVAAGGADFALTAVTYLVAAHNQTAQRLPVRFIATAHQRNPIVAVVREDCALRSPEDLPGIRAARWSMPWFTQEYAGALDYMNLGAPVIVEARGDLNQALASGDVDVLPMWMDDVLYCRDAGVPVRAIPLDIPVYSTGLVAADRLSSELVWRMREAFAAGYELQRERPELGLAGFRRHFPDVSEEHACANWALHEPYAFDGKPPGTMEVARWQRTIAYTAATHSLSIVPGEWMYRQQLVAPIPEHYRGNVQADEP